MLQIRRGEFGEVILAGRFDASQADHAGEVFDALSGPSVADFSGLDYISSMGLGVLLKTQKRLRASGAGLKLVGVNRHIREVLHYAGFEQIFEIESEGGA
jgi:anti-sigma B factor antagonist